jgi:cysteinyl-tRNA synthetase
MKLLGEHFDIHGGGIDLVFPHHENEVVQSESFTGKTFATYWLHNGLLTNKGKKISKSDPGTVVLMSDLLATHDPDTLRCLFLSSHYRRPTDYSPPTADSPGRLDEISKGLQAFVKLFERFERITGRSFFSLEAPKTRSEGDVHVKQASEEVAGLRQRFLEAMDDDFNTGGALGDLYELARSLNRSADLAKLDTSKDETALASFRAGMVVLKELAQILGLFRHPVEVQKRGEGRLAGPLIELLIELRSDLRKEKNFRLADEIRKRLSALGVTLEDRPEGTSWRID